MDHLDAGRRIWREGTRLRALWALRPVVARVHLSAPNIRRERHGSSLAVPFARRCGPFAAPSAGNSREQARTTDQESQCSRGFRQCSRRGSRF